MSPSQRPLKDIVMMEDHDQAYHAWKQRGLKNRTLVHIDAHMDFGMVPDMDLDEILGIQNKDELDRLLDCQPAWNPTSRKKGKMLHIGNYIYPAMKEGIVDKFIWVVPEPSWRSCRGRSHLKKTVRTVLKNKKEAAGFRQYRDHWAFRFLNKDIIVCGLEALQAIDESVLLDIDVDFMLTPFVWDDQDPGRSPWILPGELADYLRRKKICFDVATISYSVNGGYTPLRFKALGDELGHVLQGEIDGKWEAPEASVNFNLFIDEFARKTVDFNRARFFYQKAIEADNTYGGEFNNYAIIFQQHGKFKKAEEEYAKFLAIDPENPSLLTGSGYLSLRRRRYTEAMRFFGRVLERHVAHPGSLFGRAVASFRLKKIDDAEGLFSKVSEISSDYPESYWWLARIAQRKRDNERAIQFYKKAVLGGEEGPLVHFLLARLYFKKRNFFRTGEELKRFFHLLGRAVIS